MATTSCLSVSPSQVSHRQIHRLPVSAHHRLLSFNSPQLNHRRFNLSAKTSTGGGGGGGNNGKSGGGGGWEEEEEDDDDVETSPKNVFAQFIHGFTQGYSEEAKKSTSNSVFLDKDNQRFFILLTVLCWFTDKKTGWIRTLMCMPVEPSIKEAGKLSARGSNLA